MRCHTFWSTIWTNRKQPWVHIVYVFVVFLLDIPVVIECSSNVCRVESGADGNCSCSNTTAVQCLTLLTDRSCRDRARNSYQLFCEVMSQFDCRKESSYSVKWNCTHCVDAYTNWLLAVFSPNETWFSNCTGIPIAKISLSTLCQDVLARCPYFVPEDPYGDRPAFECLSDEEQKYSQIGDLLPCINGTENIAETNTKT